MTFPTATKDALLNGLTFTQASLHTAFPGSTGSNEVSGGSPAYARQNTVVNASSGGVRALNAAAVFNVPASTVRWIGFFNSATFVNTAPNGGATPRNFVVSGSVIYSTSHGYANAQKIVFYNGIVPTGLTEGVTYFVIFSATDSFQIAATVGGAAVSLSSTAGFGCVVCAITEAVYVAQDTHSLNTATFAVPD